MPCDAVAMARAQISNEAALKTLAKSPQALKKIVYKALLDMGFEDPEYIASRIAFNPKTGEFASAEINRGVLDAVRKRCEQAAGLILRARIRAAVQKLGTITNERQVGGNTILTFNTPD